MMRRIKILLVLALVMAVLANGSATAALVKVYGNLTPINVNGNKLYIPPGSSKTIYLNATTTVNTNTPTGVCKLQYNINNSLYYNVTLSSNIYIWNPVTKTWVFYISVKPVIVNSSSGYISWTGPPGSYNITTTISTKTGTPSNVAGRINYTFSSYNASFTTGDVYYNVTAYDVLISPTPEVVTLALVGVGAAAIVLLRRRGF